MTAFASLVTAAIAWVAVHIGIAGTSVRAAIVSRIGEGPFRGLFVVASFALLYWLGTAYGAAGPVSRSHRSRRTESASALPVISSPR